MQVNSAVSVTALTFAVSGSTRGYDAAQGTAAMFCVVTCGSSTGHGSDTSDECRTGICGFGCAMSGV